MRMRRYILCGCIMLLALVTNVYSIPMSSGYYAEVQNIKQINEYIRIIRCDGYYIVDYCPMNLDVKDTTLYPYDETPMEFSIIDAEGQSNIGILDDVGYPELPYIDLNLAGPDNISSVSVIAIPLNDCNEEPILSKQTIDSWMEYPEPNYIDYQTLNYEYLPTQSALSYLSVGIVFKNEEYYSQYVSDWNNQYNIYSVNFRRIFNASDINLQIFPYRYMPEDLQISVLEPTRFYVSYDVTYDLTELHEHLLQTGNMVSLLYFDSFTDVERWDFPHTTTKGDYLIITQSAYQDNVDLQQFMQHKVQCGYNVILETVNDVCSNTFARIMWIKNVISNHYNEGTLRYVLLVGDEKAIPPSDGILVNASYAEYDNTNAPAMFQEQIDYPPTDLYYECFDTISKNIEPKVIVGRWLVDKETNGNNQIHNIVQKTILAEFNKPALRAIVVSGCDESNYVSKYFKHDGEYIFDALSDAHYSYLHHLIGDPLCSENRSSDLIDALRETKYLFSFYRGHGNTIGTGDPYKITSIVLPNALTLSGTYVPFSLNFSCLMGQYYLTSYCVKALNASDVWGNSVCYGSSTMSYSNQNRHLSRTIADIIKTNASVNITIGELITLGELKYYSKKNKSSAARNNIKRYNLYGDPSLYIYGLSDYDYNPRTRYQLSQNQEFVESHKVNKSTLFSADTVANNVSIFDIYGRLVYYGQNIDAPKLQNGVYLFINEETQEKSVKIINF